MTGGAPHETCVYCFSKKTSPEMLEKVIIRNETEALNLQAALPLGLQPSLCSRVLGLLYVVCSKKVLLKTVSV